MKAPALLYAQSGGVTAVINATASAVLRRVQEVAQGKVRVLAARHGILGALREELMDAGGMDSAALDQLAAAPGGYFGSCRFDLEDPAQHPEQFERLFEVFAAHDIRWFLYNGGNGSMDTVLKLNAAARERGIELTCVGVPKTVDNDLEGTDCSPGFGSAAKYLAIAMLESNLDLAAMTAPRGRVFLMEVMGRNVGWLAAGSALAARAPEDAPHLVLLPEAEFNEERFLAEVERVVARLGYCAVTVAEGVRDANGEPLARQETDVLGYVQLGGAGMRIANLVSDRLGFKHHVAVPDYLQRAAGHLRSETDVAQAMAVGAAAVDYALAGQGGVMPAIRRLADAPYQWEVYAADLRQIANLERRFPVELIRPDGMHITEAAKDYLAPMIAGERLPRFNAGLPDYRLAPLPLLPATLKPYPVW